MIDSGKLLEEMVKENFKTISIEFRDQFVDIFVWLFPDAKTIQLEKLSLGHHSSSVSSVPRPGSILLKVVADDKLPCIVKIARAKKANIEIENHKRYIDERLVGWFYLDIKNSFIMWDIGGIRFPYIGSHARMLSDFYKSKTVEKIKDSLERFLKETWSANFQKIWTEKNVS